MSGETQWIGEFSLEDREGINSLREQQIYAIQRYARQRSKGDIYLCSEALNVFNLAFLDIQEALPGHELAAEGDRYAPAIRSAYRGGLMIGGGYDAELGEAAIVNGEADLIAYGVPFIANPDLVKRFRLGTSLNPPDPATFYTRGEKGYLDYPLLATV